MESTLEFNKKNEYLAPMVEICLLTFGKDVLCMSTESNDNDYDAGDLGDF